MTPENLARYESANWYHFWKNLKQGYDVFEQTRRPPRVSVCGSHYDFAPAGDLDGANPGPVEICPTTAPIIEDLKALNSRVAEPAGLPPPAIDPRAAFATAYLDLQRPVLLSRRGDNSLQQISPGTKGGVSATLTRPLSCSLAMPSCRKYAALRIAMTKEKPEASLERAVKKRVHYKKKKKKKKKRKHRKKGRR
jgi:hypothetical protein